MASVRGRLAVSLCDVLPYRGQAGLENDEDVAHDKSEFTSQIYADWPIDRRIDAYLLHQGLTEFINDGSAYNALFERVMANIGPALRNGVLRSPNN
jgi:uncharacterized protein YqjF (DUF2071 family)